MRQKLREQRLLLGYTQEKISELTGIERTRYNRIENNMIKKVPVDEAYVIAKVLLSSIEDIFLDVDVYEKHNKTLTGTDC